MNSIADKNIWCSYGPVRISFKKGNENEEFLRLCKMKKGFSDNSSESPKPVAVFAWKLLNITDIWATKQPNFLKYIQVPVECFHKNMSKLKRSVQAFDYGYEKIYYGAGYKTNVNEILGNTGNDSDFLVNFLTNNA